MSDNKFEGLREIWEVKILKVNKISKNRKVKGVMKVGGLEYLRGRRNRSSSLG